MTTLRSRVGAAVLVAASLTLALAPVCARTDAQPATNIAATEMHAPSGVAWAQLPKACWPEEQLRGRDTAFAAIPCNSLEVLPIGMRVQVDCTLERMAAGGWRARVFETVRSDRRQRYLYSYGRTRPGARVTNVATARGGFHFWGLGVDIVHATKLWSADERFWYWLGQHAEACGLVAGAFWKRFPDRPHIQYAAIESMSRAPAWAKRYIAEGQRDSLLRRLGAIR